MAVSGSKPSAATTRVPDVIARLTHLVHLADPEVTMTARVAD